MSTNTITITERSTGKALTIHSVTGDFEDYFVTREGDGDEPVFDTDYSEIEGALSEFERNQAYMAERGLPVKHRYAEGWCGGKYFCIEVAPEETLKQLQRHFQETVGNDRIQVRRWYRA